MRLTVYRCMGILRVNYSAVGRYKAAMRVPVKLTQGKLVLVALNVWFDSIDISILGPHYQTANECQCYWDTTERTELQVQERNFCTSRTNKLTSLTRSLEA